VRLLKKIEEKGTSKNTYIRRYVKIRADANPYLPEYATYFWRRRNDKESKRFGLMSACELRAMKAA